jgi:acyl-CoA thioesterase-1
MGKLLQNFRRIALVAAFCCSAVFGQTEAAPKNILFLGDSLTAGLGVAPQQAFPALIGEKIHAARLPFQVINAGVSGDTTSGGLRRVDWLMQQNTDVLVLELGANDGLRGLGVPAMKANLQAIMARV